MPPPVLTNVADLIHNLRIQTQNIATDPNKERTLLILRSSLQNQLANNREWLFQIDDFITTGEYTREPDDYPVLTTLGRAIGSANLSNELTLYSHLLALKIYFLLDDLGKRHCQNTKFLTIGRTLQDMRRFEDALKLFHAISPWNNPGQKEQKERAINTLTQLQLGQQRRACPRPLQAFHDQNDVVLSERIDALEKELNGNIDQVGNRARVNNRPQPEAERRHPTDENTTVTANSSGPSARTGRPAAAPPSYEAFRNLFTAAAPAASTNRPKTAAPRPPSYSTSDRNLWFPPPSNPFRTHANDPRNPPAHYRR